jgi:hypothetical protein
MTVRDRAPPSRIHSRRQTCRRIACAHVEAPRAGERDPGAGVPPDHKLRRSIAHVRIVVFERSM